MNLELKVEYNEEKNLIIKTLRKVSFEEVESTILKENVISDNRHTNFKKYPNQRILAVEINNYIYAVPYVIDLKKKTIFIKTVYPDRKLTKKYLKNKNKRKLKL